MTMRRRRTWADTRFDSTTQASDTQAKFDLLADAPTSDTITVARILIDFWMMPGPTNEVEGLVDIGVGIGVTSAESFAAATLPDPSETGDYPPRGWIYLANQPALQALPTGGTPTAMWRMDAHFKADVRGMRKIDKGILFMLIQTTTFNTALTLFRVGRVRALCLT